MNELEQTPPTAPSEVAAPAGPYDGFTPERKAALLRRDAYEAIHGRSPVVIQNEMHARVCVEYSKGLEEAEARAEALSTQLAKPRDRSAIRARHIAALREQGAPAAIRERAALATPVN